VAVLCEHAPFARPGFAPASDFGSFCSLQRARARARGCVQCWGVLDLSTGHPTRADVDGSKEVNRHCPAIVDLVVVL
jgi:hypothetical protein